MKGRRGQLVRAWRSWPRGMRLLAVAAVASGAALAFGAVALVTSLSLPGPELRPMLGLADTVEPCTVDPATIRRPDGEAAGPLWRAVSDVADPVDELFAVATGGRIFVGGGLTRSDDKTALRSIDSFGALDPGTGQMQPLPPLPVPLDHAAAAAYRGDVYVVGGFSDSRPQTRLWRYSPAEVRWAELPSMRVPRGAPGAAVIGDRLYVAGGVAGAQATLGTEAEAALEIYDLRTGSWSSGPPLPTARHHLGVASLDGKLYAVGGRGAADLSLDAVERFDPATGGWERLPELPVGAGGLALAAFQSRIVALGGGDDHDGWVTPATWALEPGDRKWARLGDLTVPRHGHKAVTLERRVYAVGGSPCVGWGQTGRIEALG